jgi:adenylate cyclase
VRPSTASSEHIDTDDDRELLELLTERGRDRAEIVGALTDDRVWDQAVETLLAVTAVATPAEAAEQVGVSPGELDDLCRSLGISARRDFSAGEVALLGAARALREQLADDDAGTRLLRVVGRSAAQVADAAVAAYISSVEARLDERGAPLLEYARSVEHALETFEAFTAEMPALLRRHLTRAALRARASRRDVPDPRTAVLCLGFVDLVGFTTILHGLDTSALSRLVSDFEGRAFDIVACHDGRIVKHIGDEIMFAAVDPAAACEIALGLLSEFGALEADVTPRGGLAFGEVLSRDGDYYGSVVNLAARLCDAAVPAEVLVSDAVCTAVAPDSRFGFVPAGRRQLKGFVSPVAVHTLVA